MKTVDYFSLDVEGSEIGVLRSIPFDKIDIRIISVEVVHSDRKAITSFLTRRKYKLHKKLTNDYIFVKDTVL